VEKIQNLTVDEKLGQLFFIGIPGPYLDNETRELLAEIKPGGICLFARNIKSRNQTRELLDGLTEATLTKPFLSLDQEGGLVDRLRRIMAPAPAAAKFENAADVYEFAQITAESLRILGFNMDFAPVADVITIEREDASNGMYSRGFGTSHEEALDLAGTFLKSLQAGGIIGCLKHFPGLGAARADSHDELPQIEVSDEELRTIDLYPYNKLLGDGAQVVMVAHAAYPNSHLQQSDQSGRLLPSSLSSNFVSKLLRDELGFDGVTITDDLEMGAIVKNYGIGEASKMALAAGNDMLAICAGPEAIREGYAGVCKAAATGELGEMQIDASLRRVSVLKSRLEPALTFDKGRLIELTEQLTKLNSRVS
jgi:beta-N-acetylhexosaminidase